MSIDTEVQAINSVRELPGGWRPEEWQEIKEEEVATLTKSLYPKIVNILKGDTSELAESLDENAFWRDMVSLSWTFRTFHTKATIMETVPSLIARAAVKEVEDVTESAITHLAIGGTVLRVVVPFTTSTPEASCLGVFKFVRRLDGEMKLFTVITQLSEVDAVPWKDCRNTNPVSKELPKEVDVLIIGGGHGGLALGGYLSALGMNFAIVDREKETGDSWARRYDSAVLHTIRVFSGLPFRPFPEDYPQWVGAKQLATWYKEYARDLNLPIYQDTNGEKAVFDEEKKIWTVTTSKGVIKTKLLVFSVGIFGRWPVVPTFPGQERFKGIQLHSSKYTNPKEWKGKKVVVVGSSTTGLDVALDCSLLGIDVTVVQRSPTRVYAPGHVEQFQGAFYNENSPADRGDQLTSEDPVALQSQITAHVMAGQTKAYAPEYYEGLKKAGFKGIYDGPIQEQILVKGGRHYPDIGAGWAICRGEIKIKSDSPISNVDETGIQFEDGTHLDADVIVYCTGFTKDTRGAIAEIIGDDYKLEGVWGLDKEGEIRGVFRPTGHDYIWQMGGELYAMRMYGKYLAMQLAAFLAGVRPEPVRN